MWRRYAQKVSKAEAMIFNELCKRGLGRNLNTQQAFAFNQETDGVKGTWIDFFFSYPHSYAAYIDGPLHDKKKQEKKDLLIDAALARRGILVDRFKYHPPLTKKRLREICDAIQHRIQNEADRVTEKHLFLCTP